MLQKNAFGKKKSNFMHGFKSAILTSKSLARQCVIISAIKSQTTIFSFHETPFMFLHKLWMVSKHVLI